MANTPEKKGAMEPLIVKQRVKFDSLWDLQKLTKQYAEKMCVRQAFHPLAPEEEQVYKLPREDGKWYPLDELRVVLDIDPATAEVRGSYLELPITLGTVNQLKKEMKEEAFNAALLRKLAEG